MEMKLNGKGKAWIGAIVSNVLASITGIIGLLNWSKLRQVQRVIVVNSSISYWAWNAIEIISAIILGIIWLIMVFLSQHLYSTGIKKATLGKTFSLITGIQLLIMGISNTVVLSYMGTDVGISLVSTVIYLVGGLLFILNYKFNLINKELLTKFKSD